MSKIFFAVFSVLGRTCYLIFLSYFCFALSALFFLFHYFIGPMSGHSRSILGPLSIDLFSFWDHFGSFWTNPQMFYFVFFSEHGPVMIPFQCCILPYLHTKKRRPRVAYLQTEVFALPLESINNRKPTPI